MAVIQAAASYAGAGSLIGRVILLGQITARFGGVGSFSGPIREIESDGALFSGSGFFKPVEPNAVMPKPPPRPPLAGDRHVRRSGDDYGQSFLLLLPTGQAWPRHPLSTLVLTCLGLSDYWGFVDGRAADLLETESDPRATLELLPDWERNWGLPDPCVTVPQTIEARRIALVLKMTMQGGQSRQFFIDVAAALGYTITITEYLPYICGISRVGDTRWAADNPEDPTRFMWQLGPPELRYYWTVHVTSLKLEYFHTGSSRTGIDRLLSIGTAQDLECLIDRYKPAHTDVVFDYSAVSGLDFTQMFNTGYLALGIM